MEQKDKEERKDKDDDEEEAKEQTVEALVAMGEKKNQRLTPDERAQAWKNLHNHNSTGHPSNKVNGVETSTGSLGHGLPIGVGMAIGYKIQKLDGKIFVLIGEGESNEGTIWESALLASHHKLNNLVCIMDHNKSGDRALKIDSVIKKFEAFNWNVVEIDGHDSVQINNALSTITDKPIFILANTVKGKGISMMENNPEWHHKSPSFDELEKFLKELQ
jgi:transketolase